MMSFESSCSLWEYLNSENRPVVIYGTGNGADRVFEMCRINGVEISGVYSSDDRIPKVPFHGFKVSGISEAGKEFLNPLVLLAFGTENEEVLCSIKELMKKYEIMVPDIPLTGGPVIDERYIADRAAEICEAERLFADEKSRDVFNAVLDFKKTGRPEYLFKVETPASEKRTLFSFDENSSFLDLGAYTGDTIDEFLEMSGGKYSEITALEPNNRNYIKLSHNKGNLRNTVLLNRASWDNETELLFTGKSGRMCGIINEEAGRKPSPSYVKAITVDSMNIDPSFVKMDVEGAEKETLIGMRETLNRCHPQLQISVYHMTDDFIEIPRLLERICSGYDMYLRHHPALPAWEIQIYCIYRN